MKFTPTPLSGAFLVDLERQTDARGFFARAFCAKEFAAAGLETGIVQANNSFNPRKGTLRGMHYQLTPFAEVKMVRCIRGVILDVIVDLRRDSASFLKYFGAELSSDNGRMMYVPKGFAHGFLTLADDTEVLYLVTECYAKQAERGIRWNDPAFGIAWPTIPVVISDKDVSHPDFDSGYHLV